MLTSPTNIDWDNVRAVIFDMDGTLYSQKKIRAYMAALLLGHVMIGGWRDILVLANYRKNMERLSRLNTDNVSAARFKETASALNVSEKYIADIVHYWMELKPLDNISAAAYPGMKQTFEILNARGIKIGVFSDYPVVKKLEALSLRVDAWSTACDEDVGRFKPDPKGLKKIVQILGVEVKNCLMIGDRLDKDWECARAIEMPFLLRRGGNFFTSLNKTITGG